MNQKNNTEHTSENRRVLNIEIFQRIIEVLHQPVQLLKTIKGTRDEVTGFEVIYTSEDFESLFPIPETKLLLFGEVSGSQSKYIERLRKAAESGQADIERLTFVNNGKKVNFHEEMLSFDDGVLVVQHPEKEPLPKTDDDKKIKIGDKIKDSVELLQVALDFPLFGICVYKSVRDHNDKITDFEFVLLSNYNESFTLQHELVGKKLLEEFPESLSNGLFDKYVRVVELGEVLDGDDDFGGFPKKENNWIRRLGIKLGDGLVTSWIDITGQKNAEIELQKQANLIRGISEASADILYIMDINSLEILFTTRNIAKELGYDPEFILSLKQPLLDLMHEDDVPAMILHVKNMKTAQPGEIREIEYRMKHGDGSFHFFRDRNTVFKRDENNVPIEKLGISQDISDDHTRQEDLKKHHSLLRQSEELAESGSWEYDCATKEFLWSDGMYRLFEMEKGIPVRPSVYLDYAIPEDKDIAQQIVDVMEKECDPIEVTLRIKSGETVKTLHIKTTALKDRKKSTQKILGIDMDITTARAAEEKIKKLNKKLSTKNRELETLNSELKTFNNIAANDYKDTLRSLYINLENVIKADASGMSDTGKGNLRKAQIGIQKMKLLTDDLVAFSRIPMLDNNSTTVNFNELIQHVISGLDDKVKESGAKISIGQLPTLQGMPVLLSLLFHHLIDNAMKFRDPNKKPEIKIDAHEISKHQPGDGEVRYHIVTITDDGIGFDPKESEKLFTIFYRLHERSAYRGSGIGLAVCRKIMAMHGGYISAEGLPGTGSVISCSFPA